MASSASTAIPLVAPLPGDLERGTRRNDGVESQNDIESQLSMYYHAVYGFSVFVLTLGIWAFFFPFSESSLVANAQGTGGIVIGLNLILNSDLLVTYLRMVHQMGRFKDNNRRFRAGVAAQKKNLRRLKETEKALERLESRFCGSLEQIEEEVAEMRGTARDNTRRNIDGILMITRRQLQDIQAGELEGLLQIFSNSYCFAFPHIVHRFDEMRKGFEASTRWQQVQALSCNRFMFILTNVLFEDEEDIMENVKEKLDAETDELASGWFKSKQEAKQSQAWAQQFQHFQGQEEAPPQKRDSWADALDFVGLGSGPGEKAQPTAMPTAEEDTPSPSAPARQDSWADAMAFAGVDK